MRPQFAGKRRNIHQLAATKGVACLRRRPMTRRAASHLGPPGPITARIYAVSTAPPLCPAPLRVHGHDGGSHQVVGADKCGGVLIDANPVQAAPTRTGCTLLTL